MAVPAVSESVPSEPISGRADVRALAEADPFVTNGLRTFELKEWTIMEGSLGLKVNLSDQSIEVA